MRTLTEIEAAVDKLSPPQQAALLAFLASRLGQPKPRIEDPVLSVIGAFTGQPGSTGRQAEEILYGSGVVP